MKIITRVTGYIAICIFFFACAKLEEEPIGKIAPNSVFDTESGAEGVILGVYTTLTSSDCLWMGELSMDILSDEYDVTVQNVRPFRYIINQYEHNASDFDANQWFGAFASINSANQVIEYLPDSDLKNIDLINQYIAEARFVRALVYFRIVRTYGDVPLFLKPLEDPNEASSKTRESAEIVYENIIKDLQFASEHLPPDYPGTGEGVYRARATAGAALTCLAKVHLTLATYNQIYKNAYTYRTIDMAKIDELTGSFSSHWEAAAYYAQQVIDREDEFGYELIRDYQNNFNGNIGDTEEFIFSLDFSGLVKGGGVAGQDFDGWKNNAESLVTYRRPNETGGWSAIAPPYNFYQSFDVNDYRTSVNFDTIFVKLGENNDTIATYHYTDLTSYPYPHCAKWTRYPGTTMQNNGSTSSYNWPVFRYAEVLLIAAEALNETGNTSMAVEYLNLIKERARKGKNGLQNNSVPADLAPSLSKEECWKAIWEERKTELAFEQKRWFDLVRRDSLISVMSRFIPVKTGKHINPQEHHILYPIPQEELDRTAGLVQNKGY